MFNKIINGLRGSQRNTKTVILLCILFSLIVPVGFAAISDVPDSVGTVQASDILTHYPAFRENYEDYSPTMEELLQFRQLADKELVVMFGTWCHDSEREVPRLLKLIDSSEVALRSLTLLAVDRNKQEPSGKSERWRLKYTPTIILKANDQELGRIIEKPKVSLAYDLANMLDD